MIFVIFFLIKVSNKISLGLKRGEIKLILFLMRGIGKLYFKDEFEEVWEEFW